MTEIEEKLLSNINKRLALLIYAQFRRNEIEQMTMGEQFVLLRGLGFGDTEISELFGKSRSYVSSEIVRHKKKVK